MAAEKPSTWVSADDPHPHRLLDEVQEIETLAALRAKEALDHPRYHKCDACKLRRQQQRRDAA